MRSLKAAPKGAVFFFDQYLQKSNALDIKEMVRFHFSLIQPGQCTRDAAISKRMNVWAYDLPIKVGIENNTIPVKMI